MTRAAPVDQSVVKQLRAVGRSRASYLELYRRAARHLPGLPWTVLAGIGTVETGNGRDVHRSIAGAEGPMQFQPSTWALYGIDADGDGKANINDPTDAVFSAARYLCAAGAGRGATGDRPGASSPTTTPGGTSERCSSSPTATPEESGCVQGRPWLTT